ncbi:MAG: PEP-CTERM sorting domain-containing protein [Verrucomicrobia bacterium]|nr:PEP-CTERM sorting domain-containing protein [Verrucomicrobiota bacterium]
MRTLIVLVFALTLISSSYGATLAIWDFGPDAAGYTEVPQKEVVTGTPTLTMFTGTGYDADGTGGTAYVDDDSDAHAAGQAASWASGVNDGQNWILTINLTGYEVTSLRFDGRATGTGPSGADLDYNIGAGWVSLLSPTFPQDSAFHAYSTSVPTAVDDQASVQFRLSNFTGGSGGGTFVFDNLEVIGVEGGGGPGPGGAVPEPSTAGLMLVAIGFMVAGRRKGFHVLRKN